MPLVYACIAPHGGNLLLTGPTPVPECRDAMHKIGQRMLEAAPDAIAVLTPHGVSIDGKMSLGVTPRARGEVGEVSIDARTDLDLASVWARLAEENGVPVALLSGRDPGDALPLDWGVVIPLAFMTPLLKADIPVVVACPSRELSDAQLLAWGRALVEASDTLGKRVALIVSADQGHGHAADGPYGFAPESEAYDRAMVDAVKANDLSQILAWPTDFAEIALADSYWQTVSLIGAQECVPMHSRFLAYEVDHYFGLMCASFEPVTERL